MHTPDFLDLDAASHLPYPRSSGGLKCHQRWRRWVILVLGLLAVWQSPRPAAAAEQSYTLKIQPGLNLVANQLDRGGNTLNEVLPGVPDGTVLYLYNNSQSAWSVSSYSSAARTWLNGDNLTLPPGEGAFLEAAEGFALTFSGEPHVPKLPLSLADKQVYLLSQQTNDVGRYAAIVGAEPTPGTTVYRWAGKEYQRYDFGNADPVWSPSEPVAEVGEAWWISTPGAGVPPPTPVAHGLTVISPGTGESFCAGTTQTILWSGGNPAWNVLISLVDVPSWTVYSTITPSTPNTGSYVWNVPPSLPASSYLIYIQEVSVLTWAYGGTFAVKECPAPPCVTPPANLALWLPLDETNGTTSVNLAPGGNNGTRFSSPTVISGYVSNSLSFNGISQYVSVPDYPAINAGPGQDFSIDAWIRRATNSANSPPRVIVDKRDPTAGTGYSLALSFGNLVFQMNNGSGFSNFRDTGVIPPDDRWHFITVTVIRNQTNGGRFYIDGSLTSTFNPTAYAGSLVNTSSFQVAASLLAGNAPWLGALDEVEFFQRALKPDEVLALYQAGASGKCKPRCDFTPGVLCPPNKTVECGSRWSFDPPTAVDPACTNLVADIVSTVTNNPTGTPCSREIIRTWRGIDCCGNVFLCSQTITVVDTTPPMVDCPPGFGTDCSFPWKFDMPTAIDACSGTNVTITVLSTTTNGHCPFAISRTWLITDRCGNATNCTQTVYVGDSTPPELICPPNKTAECGSDWAFNLPLAHDACCGDVTVEVISTVTNTSPVKPCVQFITRTWRATDCCGNTNLCSQTITLQDTTPPQVACNRDKIVECGQPWTFDPPAATDACCGTNVVIAELSTVTNVVALKCTESITRAWSVTDCCGNSALCFQTVTVVDKSGPIFTGPCVTNVTLVGGNNFTAPIPASPSPGLLARLTAAGITQFKGFDDCRVNAYFAHTFTNLPRCITAATLTVRLKPCNDFCDNDSIGVSFTSPAGVLQSNAWSRFLGWGNAQPGLLPGSWCANTTGQVLVLDLAALPQPSGPPLNLLPQLNALGYLDFTSQDDSGIDYLQLSVTSCCERPEKTVECGTAWTFDQPGGLDACCGTNVTLSVVSTVTNGICPRIATRTWQATDCCGNASFYTQTVTLVDTTPPVIFCPGPIKRFVCTDGARVFYNVYAYDACSGYRPVTCTPASGSMFPLGTTTVTCTSTDACGNVATCTFTVTVAQQILSATALLGLPDCYTMPTEFAPKSGALLAAYPGACWKPFDFLFPNCSFGASFLGLPKTLTCGTLTVRMRPYCNSLPSNDAIAVGIVTNSTGGLTVPWYSYIGSGNPSPGLITNLWCTQSGCVQSFTFNLASMPAPGGNLLPVVNAQGKLDFYVQDDTAVDYAQLDYCYCRAKPWWHGWEWDLVNAEIAIGQDFASFSPLWSPGYQTNFSIRLEPGATRGIRLDLLPLRIGETAGSSLTLATRTIADPDAEAIQIIGDGQGTLKVVKQLGRPKIGEASVQLRLGGLLVAHTNRPAIPKSELLTLKGPGALIRLEALQSGAVMRFTLDQPSVAADFGDVLADEFEIVWIEPDTAPDNRLASLQLDLDGLPELVLTSAATQLGDVFPLVRGDALALATGDQLSLSNLGDEAQEGFDVTTPPTDLLALDLAVARSATSEPKSNGRIISTFIGQSGPDVIEAGRVSLIQSRAGWFVDGDFAALGAPQLRAEVYLAGKLVGAVDGGRPEISSLPARCAGQIQPKGVSLSLTWLEAQEIQIGGSLFTGDELRLLPVNPDLPIRSLFAAQVRATGVDSLVLAAVGRPAPVWFFEPPVVTSDAMILRWSGPGSGVLESAPTPAGPWSTVPDQGSNSAAVSSPLTNGVPSQFFRIRSN